MSNLGVNALASLAAIAAVVACSAAYSDTQAPGLPVAQAVDAGGLFCEVTAEPTRNGLLIEAHASANRNVDGEYDLRIRKSGRGGSSDVSQGGFAAIAAGESVTLGQTELSVERGARVHADLVVRDGRGELCRRSVGL